MASDFDKGWNTAVNIIKASLRKVQTGEFTESDGETLNEYYAKDEVDKILNDM